jgi:hypothetical protein
MAQRLTTAFKKHSGPDRYLLVWCRKLSDVFAGVTDKENINRNSLIKSLSIIQNENKIEEVINAEKWIDEIEKHIELLKKNLQISKNYIEKSIKK